MLPACMPPKLHNTVGQSAVSGTKDRTHWEQKTQCVETLVNPPKAALSYWTSWQQLDPCPESMADAGVRCNMQGTCGHLMVMISMA